MSRADLAPLLKQLQSQGFIVCTVKNGHYEAKAPEHLGGRKVQFAKTPGDCRSVKNIVTRLRRIGFVKEKK